MNKPVLKKLGYALAGILGGAYLLFLLVPFAINPMIEKYIPQIKDIIKTTTGLDSEILKLKVVTTPKLTAGLKAEKFAIIEPEKDEILSAEKFSLKMSLIPLLAGKIELDSIQLAKVDANIIINPDKTFAIEKYFPKQEENMQKQVETSEPVNLPFKLSNKLPDIKIGGYDIKISNRKDEYILNGTGIEISDFVLDKSIKLKASGKGLLKGREQFSYNIKIFNKLMPEIQLNDIVFNHEPVEEQTAPDNFEMPDIIGILNGIYSADLTASVNADLKISKDGINGEFNIKDLSLVNLPNSAVNLKFKGEKIDILSDIYTAKNEVSKINGFVKTGKNPNVDLSFKSNLELNNILKIVKEIALIFDIKDLQTLTANGKLDADFNIKSNFKTLKSNGYLKIPSAKVYYGLYNVGIENINADVKLENNNVDIRNIGFEIFNQPLKFYGTISESALCDLKLSADNLSLKGFMVAFGQTALLKENQINSGLISLNAQIKGNLDKINPVLTLGIQNINIKNIPADTSIIAPNTGVEIVSDGVTFNGIVKSSGIKLLNPCAKILIPNVNASIKEKEIELAQTQVAIEKINLNVCGKISDYLTEKIGLNFVTTGDIKSALTGDLNLAKQSLNLNYATTETSAIIIPMFDKSKMTFTGNIGIAGSMLNPILKGAISIPSLKIPEIPVEMKNLNIKLDGPVAKGSGTLDKFTSGGIEAENLTSDFALKGVNFYLTNLKGNAFGGKIGGNIIYNLSNAKTSVDFLGEGMNAERAVYGGVGIKNAIEGSLGFKTKLTLVVADYDEMMKSMKGDLSFDIKNGSFGALGRFDRLLSADNIISNSLLKTTINSIANTAGVADTAKFDYLDGNLTFANGWAEIKSIKSSGKSLAYYVTGKYNLLNGTTNLNILGRLDAKIVAKLGVIGELSAEKLFSYIPKFGSATAKIVNTLTSNPKGENVSAIPSLTSGETNCKDFKVTFNGGLESTSSIKSFKWLTTVDMSEIETKTVKETIQDIKSSLNVDYKNTLNAVKENAEQSKAQWNSAKEDFNAKKDQLKSTADEFKNLFKKQ